MKKQLLVVAGLSMFAVAQAGAQDRATSQCPAGNVGSPIANQDRAAQDACQQAADLFQYMAPQLALALAGGNATLGQGSTLGGLGHFSIGVRGNVFQGSLPQVGSFTQSYNGAQRNPSLPTKDQWIGLPTADAAIGIFAGIPLALTNVGGIDALVSASYVPTFDSDDVSVTPESNLQVGYGVRVGVLSEGIVVPGLAFTWLKRDLPTTTIIGTAGSAATLSVRDLSVKTTAWRVVASKSLLLFSFAAGYGKDNYDGAADITARVATGIAGVGDATVTVPDNTQELERTNMFFDAALNLPLFKIVGEVGKSSGGQVLTYNGFSGGRADRDQTYYSVGIRFGF